MIRLNESTKQIRVDTSIKIIEQDGTEVTAPVTILIGVNKVEVKQQFNIYKIANVLFNKDFILDRQPITPKKSWWKMW
jgi:hypothetical protein